MDYPFDNYDRLISILQQADILLAGGIKGWRRLLQTPSPDPDQGVPEQAIRRLEEAYPIHSVMWLVYGVALLEGMVKDYARYAIYHRFTPNAVSSYRDDGDPLPVICSALEDDAKLPPSSWNHRVDKWLEKAGASLPAQESQDQRSVDLKKLRQFLSDHVYWKLFLKCFMSRPQGSPGFRPCAYAPRAFFIGRSAHTMAGLKTNLPYKRQASIRATLRQAHRLAWLRDLLIALIQPLPLRQESVQCFVKRH